MPSAVRIFLCKDLEPKKVYMFEKAKKTKQVNAKRRTIGENGGSKASTYGIRKEISLTC